MEPPRRSRRAVLRLLPAAALLVCLPVAARADLATCRADLFMDLDPPAALTSCGAAVDAAPTDGAARLLRALATIAHVPFRPAVDALLASFGFSEDGRYPPDLDLLLPGGDLDPDSPQAFAVQAVVQSDVLPAIDDALADLAAIEAPFTLALTPAELAAFGVTVSPGVEVDEADALLLAGALEALGAALRIGVSYELDFDIDDAVLRFSSSLDIQDEIIDDNPDLLTLLPAAPVSMAAAKQGLCAAVDSYHLGIQALEAEVDLQHDDLIVVADPALEAQVSQELARLRAALDRPFRVLVGAEDWKARTRVALNEALGTGFDATGLTLDLRDLFDAPLVPRPLAPVFDFDPFRIPPSGVASYPDPTFAGALTGAAPGSGVSSTPCPPAVVPEPSSLVSAAAAWLVLAGLARRRGVVRGPGRPDEPA